jgi:hypothetical protein
MPNYVKHKMTVNGQDEDVQQFFKAIKNKDDLFDFGNLVPVPEHIKLPDGVDGISSFVIDAAELLMIHSGQKVLDFRGIPKRKSQIIDYGHTIKWEDKHFEWLIRCCKAIQETSFSNWWPWNMYNWGTKWGAYSITRKGNEIEFETAWSTPMPIWNKIAELFPALSISILYADEDYGANCGNIKIENGNVERKEIDTKEFSYKVWNTPLAQNEVKE